MTIGIILEIFITILFNIISIFHTKAQKNSIKLGVNIGLSYH